MLNKKPDIIYPCLWQYKVIGEDKLLVEEAINRICGGSAKINHANTSSSGKYHSFNVELEVADEQERNNIFAKLQKHQYIKMVI
ncbi:MAG: hypothetical protein CSB24_02790 [Deltaproteobacteria bacterium]|nr:MAG: hypothetical protein CSB24_02790 [Deltaproteobacteria bacterium]